MDIKHVCNSLLRINFSGFYLGIVFLDESRLPESVCQLLRSHEARLEVGVEDMIAVMFLPPEVITKVHRHLRTRYLLIDVVFHLFANISYLYFNLKLVDRMRFSEL